MRLSEIAHLRLPRHRWLTNRRSGADTNRHTVVLFDGVCNLCNRAVDFIIRRDHREIFQFASLQSAAGREIARRYCVPRRMWRSVILVQNDRVYGGSTAALKIAAKLSWPWPILSLGLAVPRRLRDWIYSLMTTNRYRIFGKRSSCRIISPEEQMRFLSDAGSFAESPSSALIWEFDKVVSSYAISSTFAKDEQAAREVFRVAAHLLLDLACWDELSGPQNASFLHFDANGDRVTQRRLCVGDFIRVDLPAPGYDWAVIEEAIVTRTKIKIVVRPTYDPTLRPLRTDVICHFYEASASNTFVVERQGNEVIVSVHGAGEIMNVGATAGSRARALRNRLAALASWRGPQQYQWNTFTDRLLLRARRAVNWRSAIVEGRQRRLYAFMVAAGLGQIILAVSMHWMPEKLNLPSELSKLMPLTRQIYVVCAYYIWATVLLFGMVSAVKPRWLLDRSPAAILLSAFLAFFWLARLAIQFFYYERTTYAAEETLLVLLFTFLSIAYSVAAVSQLKDWRAATCAIDAGYATPSHERSSTPTLVKQHGARLKAELSQ